MSGPVERSGETPDWRNADRLAALDAYDILDSPPEQAFDDLARIAALVCRTPVALVNFVAEDRQWFKAEIGLRTRETPLDVAFCTHVILQPHLFVVPDTTKDPRFNCNPLVTEDPFLRFYAGAARYRHRDSSRNVVCADYAPRPGLSSEHAEILMALARQGTILLEY